MFTGLIKEKGKLTRIIPRGRTILLTCRASKKLLADYQIGDSMAINGVFDRRQKIRAGIYG